MASKSSKMSKRSKVALGVAGAAVGAAVAYKLFSCYQKKSRVKTRVVLPDGVVPRHYELKLHPNFVNFSFSGEVKIHLEVFEAVPCIKVNAADIQFGDVTVVHGGSVTSVPGNQVELDEKDQIATIPIALEAGRPVLHIKFTGTMNDKLVGFYRSKYTLDGEASYIGCTQFEAVDARRAFPCWDEPSRKASFSLTLEVPAELTTLSNMPAESSTPIEGKYKRVVFEKTPVMSTYLLAWVIGKLESIETTTESGTSVKVYTPIGQTGRAEFALDVAEKVLPFYEKYFDIPYPLPKMDLVALPDFSSGAMENWGLVTYRDTALLCDADSSQASRQYVAIVVAHELAHQWFGNLVTMEWWSDLWLNEGFASFMEYLATDEFFPEWSLFTEFVSDNLDRALCLDALATSHPIEVPVYHPDEVDEIFDTISYLKGSSVVRMIHEFLGADVFQKAIQKYLKHFRYGNAVTNDLWHFLSVESNRDVTGIMSQYTRAQGFPLVEITRVAQEGSQLMISLRQTRFLKSGRVAPENDKVTWSIPLVIDLGGEDTKVLLMKGKTLTISVPDNLKWVKINKNASGVYRVKYEPRLLDKLTMAVRSEELGPMDRVNLLSDAAAMVPAGYASATDLLCLMEAYSGDTDQAVWDGVLGALFQVMHIMREEDGYPLLQLYGQVLLSSIHERLGWEKRADESDRESKLRAQIIGALGACSHQPTVDGAKERFAEMMDGHDIAPDIREKILPIVVRNGGIVEWQQVKKIFETTTDASYKIRALCALGASKDKTLLKKTLDYSMSDSVRRQDAPYAISGVGRNTVGTQVAWDWLKENFETLKTAFPGSGLLQSIIGFPRYFCSETKAYEIERFFRRHPVVGCERTVGQTVESIRLNAQWLDRDGKAIEQWLQNWQRQRATSL
eukprot:37030_1